MQFTEAQIKQLQAMFDAGLSTINKQLKTGESRMDTLAHGIDGLASKQDLNNRKTDEMYEAFDFAKRGLAFIGAFAAFIGRVVTWAVKVGVPLTGAYMAIRGFKWPWNK